MKMYLIIASIAVSAAFTSCSNKVQLLKTITYEDDSYTEFEYDNQNRITKMSKYSTNEDFNKTQTLTYSGNDLVRIVSEVFYLNDDEEYTKSGNIIRSSTGYTIELDNDGYPTKRERASEGFSFVTTYQYQSGNLTKVSFKQMWDDFITGEGITEYKYDNMKSPFLYCKTPKWYFICVIDNSIQNNITEKNHMYNKVEYTYEYEYNNAGFPTKMTMTDKYYDEVTVLTFQYVQVKNK